MISQQTLFTRALAMLLPLCFLWVFISCVIFCTAHGSEAEREDIRWSVDETTFISETDCCPVRVAQLSLLPERRSPVPQIGGDQHELCALSTDQFSHQLPVREWSLHRPP